MVVDDLRLFFTIVIAVVLPRSVRETSSRIAGKGKRTLEFFSKGVEWIFLARSLGRPASPQMSQKTCSNLRCLQQIRKSH